MSPQEIITHAFDRFERPLISYAREITGDLEAARDAVQETFLRLSRQDIVRLEPRLTPWLFFVCRNCALDHVRKVVRFVENSPEHERPSDELSPDASAMATEDSTRLRELVSRLPQQQRELIKLKFESGLSYKEMAEVLKTSVSTVGVQLHGALQTLRQHWNRPTHVTP